MKTKTILGLGMLVAILGLACGETTADDGEKGTTNAAQSTSDPGGVCTKHQCGTPQPGDCSLDKCADYQTSCFPGRMTNVRCVPDPFAGQGSAPPDQCVLVGECKAE